MKKVVLLSLGSLLALSQNGFASPFLPGDLVVVQAGDGTAALSSAATPVFLDEFTITGTPVQSFGLPTAVSGFNRALTLSGTATSEGFLRLSTDGQFLTLAGYDAGPGTASITTSQPGTINRVIGAISGNGSVNTTTAISTGLGTTGNPRAVVSDGAQFWLSTSAAGVNNVAAIGASAATQLAASPANTRAVGIYGGQLFATSGSSPNIGVNQYGTGTPTTGGQTVTLNIADGGVSPSPYGFVLADMNPNVAGLDTAWVADDRTLANGGGIQKYLFDGTAWTLSYTLGTGGTLGARGLTVDLSGVSPILYAITTESSANKLVSVVDTGAGSAATVLATAAANTVFRGVDFAPQIIPEPTSVGLLLGGLGLVGWRLRRKK